ncbi:MAG TPA: SpoIIIAH-like family protein [Clostridia bacterium]|nr:SpoIIIAH-like family protein [Clostridia bacterium]
MKKFRMNMIVGKKQIILAALVLCLSLAVYLNWVYSGDGFELPTTSTLETDKNYGDSQYVNIGEDADAFFAEAKISRQKTRDEAVQTLKNLIESDAITPEQRTELALKTTSMAQAIEKEGKIENLIKAKGFTDCMVYYDTERVDVIVKTNGLLTNEVAQMKDIIVKEVTIPDENIAIIEVN